MSRFSQDINAIDRHLRNHRREYMEPLGLKGIHARLFVEICRTPGRSQDQLAKKMGIDKSTIARQVEALEAQDFVSRRPSQKDKRVLCVYPTEKMSEFLPGLDAAMQTWEQELLQELTETECQQLYAILAKLRLRVDPEV